MARPGPGILEALAAEGRTGSDALQTIREAGFTYADSAFWSDWGRALATSYQADLEAGSSLTALPTFGEMSAAATDLSATFLQKVLLAMRDQETGELITQVVSISTDQLMSRADAIAYAQDMFAQNADRYGVTIEGGSYAVTQYRA